MSKWTKFAPPLDMLQQEEKTKKMEIGAEAKQQYTEKILNELIQDTDARQDPYVKQALIMAQVKNKKKEISKKVEQYFIEDFILWLQGKSFYNREYIMEQTKINSDLPDNKIERLCTPWGTKALTFMPDIKDFFDKIIANRSHVAETLAILRSRVPKNINEAWIYYKYLVRGFGVDEVGLKELEFFDRTDSPQVDIINKQNAVGDANKYRKQIVVQQDEDNAVVKTIGDSSNPTTIPDLYQFDIGQYRKIYVRCMDYIEDGQYPLNSDIRVLSGTHKLLMNYRIKAAKRAGVKFGQYPGSDDEDVELLSVSGSRMDEYNSPSSTPIQKFKKINSQVPRSDSGTLTSFDTTPINLDADSSSVSSIDIQLSSSSPEEPSASNQAAYGLKPGVDELIPVESKREEEESTSIFGSNITDPESEDIPENEISIDDLEDLVNFTNRNKATVYVQNRRPVVQFKRYGSEIYPSDPRKGTYRITAKDDDTTSERSSQIGSEDLLFIDEQSTRTNVKYKGRAGKIYENKAQIRPNNQIDKPMQFKHEFGYKTDDAVISAANNISTIDTYKHMAKQRNNKELYNAYKTSMYLRINKLIDVYYTRNQKEVLSESDSENIDAPFENYNNAETWAKELAVHMKNIDGLVKIDKTFGTKSIQLKEIFEKAKKKMGLDGSSESESMSTNVNYVTPGTDLHKEMGKIKEFIDSDKVRSKYFENLRDAYDNMLNYLNGKSGDEVLGEIRKLEGEGGYEKTRILELYKISNLRIKDESKMIALGHIFSFALAGDLDPSVEDAEIYMENIKEHKKAATNLKKLYALYTGMSRMSMDIESPEHPYYEKPEQMEEDIEQIIKFVDVASKAINGNQNITEEKIKAVLSEVMKRDLFASTPAYQDTEMSKKEAAKKVFNAEYYKRVKEDMVKIKNNLNRTYDSKKITKSDAIDQFVKTLSDKYGNIEPSNESEANYRTFISRAKRIVGIKLETDKEKEKVYDDIIEKTNNRLSLDEKRKAALDQSKLAEQSGHDKFAALTYLLFYDTTKDKKKTWKITSKEARSYISSLKDKNKNEKIRTDIFKQFSNQITNRTFLDVKKETVFALKNYFTPTDKKLVIVHRVNGKTNMAAIKYKIQCLDGSLDKEYYALRIQNARKEVDAIELLETIENSLK